LIVYKTQTAPLIDFYKEEGTYQYIKGIGTVDSIFADICQVIDSNL
jgi:adenylate kinase